MTAKQCPFCDVDPARFVVESQTAMAIPDIHPVAEGHTLVIPKRHVQSLFDLPEEEQADLWRLVARVRARLIELHHPDGFNIGVNDGPAAGQSVLHGHVHVVPRRRGDGGRRAVQREIR